MARHKTVTFRFDDRDHEILNSLAKARGQNKTQVLKRMLREEMAREKLLTTIHSPTWEELKDEGGLK